MFTHVCACLAQIFDKEQADVKREHEEAQRKRLEDAEQYRRALAQQEDVKRVQRTNERAVADAYAQQQAQQVAAWEAHEREVRRKQHDTMVEEAKRCQLELQRTQQQHLAAQQKKAQSELRAVERYNQQLAAEARQRERRKLEQQREVALVKQANALQLERKRADAAREQEEELALQKAYEQKLALQDAQRQRELQAIVDKQSKKVQLALLNVQSAEERAREDEARAAAVQAQVRKREDDELARRAARKQEGARVQVAALQQQRAERRDRFVQEQVAEDAYARACKRDFTEWQQVERSKQVSVRARNCAYQALVKQQMQCDDARRASDDKYGMSVEEMALNAELLKRAGVAELPADAPRTRKA